MVQRRPQHLRGLSARLVAIALAIVAGACGSAPPQQAAALEQPARSAPTRSDARPPAAVAVPPVLEATERGEIEIEAEIAWPAVTTTEAYPQELLAIGWLKKSELEGGHPMMGGVVALFPRMRVFDVRGKHDVRVGLNVPDEPVALIAVLDRERRFLSTMFGRGHLGNAIATTEPDRRRAGDVVAVKLASLPTRSDGAELCAGDRFQLVEVDAPTVRGEAPATKRRLCAYLPKSYATDAKRRYPVVYALPGLAGSDVAPLRGSDHFGAVMDGVSAAARREVIVVGVDTRSPHGSSYFADSSAQGPWATFGATTMVKAIDERFRTIARPESRALVGHSTGGFDAVSLAMRRPDVFGVVGASSPDALDLDGWLWSASGEVRAPWLGWLRLEDAMGGPGQIASYGAAWSADEKAPRGFAWPVDPRTGKRDERVAAAWRAASPSTWLDTPEGLARAKNLSGKIYVTCGKKDEALLFEPTERYVRKLEQKGVVVAWRPTELGHVGAKRERLEPMLRFVVDGLKAN